jgi:hypothetical protein
MDQGQLLTELEKDLQLSFPVHLSMEQLQAHLADRINELIQTDFERLVGLLYRIDVSESKLKQCLKATPGEDTGKIMAALVIERELQKISTREHFSGKATKDSQEENW